MVAYKLDNALVAKYPTSKERRASSSNGSKASANKEDAHCGEESAEGAAMTHSVAKHLPKGG
jgi:hypothetical protein